MASGLHVTPGLIDPHSHTAILGAVNESTLPSTAMVRISDVVNSETDNLYQQLAGGVTAVNLFHGSANPIGGQSCVIKLRDGASPGGPDLRRRAARHQVRAGREREAIQLGREVRDALSPNPHGRAHLHRQPLHRRPGIPGQSGTGLPPVHPPARGAISNSKPSAKSSRAGAGFIATPIARTKSSCSSA